MKLNLDLKSLKEVLDAMNAKKVFIQLPDGLKIKSQEIDYALKKFSPIFSLDPIYGACDLQENYHNLCGADVTIHFGHNEFCKPSKKTIFWPCYYDITAPELNDIKNKLIKKFKGKKIILTYSIQYKKIVDELIKIKEIKFIKGNINKTIKEPGQILGCNASTIPFDEKLDAIVYLGDGYFHPSAIRESIDVFRLFPFRNIEKINLNLQEKKRKDMLKYIIKDKTNFGIFITRKEGQKSLENAYKVKELLEQNNKSVMLLWGDNLSNDKIIGQGFEVIVNTACPRIVDDYQNYKPILIVNPKHIFSAFK